MKAAFQKDDALLADIAQARGGGPRPDLVARPERLLGSHAGGHRAV